MHNEQRDMEQTVDLIPDELQVHAEGDDEPYFQQFRRLEEKARGAELDPRFRIRTFRGSDADKEEQYHQQNTETADEREEFRVKIIVDKGYDDRKQKTREYGDRHRSRVSWDPFALAKRCARRGVDHNDPVKGRGKTEQDQKEIRAADRLFDFLHQSSHRINRGSPRLSSSIFFIIQWIS